MEKNTKAAFEEIDRLSSRNDLYLLYNVCQYFILSRSDNPDKDEIESLTTSIDKLRLKSNDFCLHSSAYVSWCFGDLNFAQQLLDLVKNKNVSASLNGWIALSRREYKTGLTFFDSLLSNRSKSIDLLALYGKAVLLAEVGDFSSSIQEYAKILSHYDFPEINIEKARIYIAMNKFSMANDCALHVINTIGPSESKPEISAENPKLKYPASLKLPKAGPFSLYECHLIQLLYCILSKSDIIDAEVILKQIENDFKSYEPNNWQLALLFGQMILSLCHQTSEILEPIINIISFVSKHNPGVFPFLAYCHMMKHDYINANAILEHIGIENENIYSIEARLNTLFETNRTAEVQDKLDLYHSISEDSIQLKTMEVKLHRIIHGSTGQNVYDLCRLIVKHVNGVNKKKEMTQIHDKIFTVVNHQIADKDINNENETETEENVHSDENEHEETSNEICDVGFSLEDYMENFKNKFAPMETNFERFMEFYADLRIDSIVSAFDEMILENKSLIFAPVGLFGQQIESIFQSLFKLTPHLSPLSVQYSIFLQINRKYKEALTVIKNYLIRRWPFRQSLLFLTASVCECKIGNVDIARMYLDSAISSAPVLSSFLDSILVRCKIEQTTKYLPDYAEQLPILPLLQIIDLCIEVNQYEKARWYFKSAAVLAHHPKEKAHIVIRQAKLLAFKKDYERAFRILKQLSHHQKYLVDAIHTIAYIYLHFLNDTDNYMLQYEQLCEHSPTVQHFLIAGDAFSEICEFDGAAQFYKEAHQQANNSETLQKLVNALIKSHQFNNAISKYKKIGTTPLFLIEALTKLKQYNQAKQYLDHSIRLIRSSNSLAIAPYIELRGDIQKHLKEGNAIDDYRSALSIYSSILKDALPSAFIDELKRKASTIAIKIGHLKPAREKILDDFYLSLKYDPSNVDSLVSIFNFYKARNDLKTCNKLCVDFLSKYSSSETVALLLTTVEKHDFTKSINSLGKVLDNNPHFHRALVRLVEICARAGQLKIAKNRINAYIDANDNSPGIQFARALFYYYIGDIEKAMTFFTLSSKNRRWSTTSKLCMFHLLVNPERKYIWCETAPLATEENLQKASFIMTSIGEINEIESMLLTAELFSSHNTEEAVKKSLDLYNEIIEIQQNNIAALVGVARCNIRLGNPKLANVFIDKVLLFKPFHETYIYFEECYLMRASIIASERDFLSSQQFVYMAIDLNLSSKKGWEMNGSIHKQNKMYAEAALAYSNCWELSNKKDAMIGYNYAYCSLLADRPDQTLVVCRKLLEDNPLNTEIVDKLMVPAFKKIKC